MAKQLLVPGNLFEELGFKYVGPDQRPLHRRSSSRPSRSTATTRHPVLVHVVTRKGQGYEPAEQDPVFWHGADPFSVETGEVKKKPGPPSYTKVFAETLTELARHDPRIVAITAAMPEGTGLDVFAKAHPATASSTSGSASSTRSPSPPAWRRGACARWWRSTRRSCSAPTTRSSTTSA